MQVGVGLFETNERRDSLKLELKRKELDSPVTLLHLHIDSNLDLLMHLCD